MNNFIREKLIEMIKQITESASSLILVDMKKICEDNRDGGRLKLSHQASRVLDSLRMQHNRKKSHYNLFYCS